MDRPHADRGHLTWRTLYISGLQLHVSGLQLHVSGLQLRELVTKGPYPVVRNPLDLFTLLGAAGIGALGEASLWRACA